MGSLFVTSTYAVKQSDKSVDMDQYTDTKWKGGQQYNSCNEAAMCCQPICTVTTCKLSSRITHHHHHHVPEGLGVFPVP